MARFDFAPHFTEEEFSCRCSCGVLNPNRPFLERLERARIRADVPFVIISGSRCEDHNQDVGGVDSSSHLASIVEAIESYAGDIAARSSRQRGIIVPSLVAVGFNRIGIAKSFVHVDIHPELPPNVIWLY